MVEHTYYIVRCYNKSYELDYKYLEYYLQLLHIMPDTKAMKTIANLDKKVLSKKSIPLNDYCDNTISLPNFDKSLIKADIFFINPIQSFRNIRFNKYPKFLVNKIDYSIMDKFFNKSNILKIICNDNPELVKYCPISFALDDIKKYKFPKWYILRPLDSYSGTDIFYINNKLALDKYIKYYNGKKNYKGIIYGNNVLASEYIDNPLLFNNKKFHLRLYLLVSITTDSKAFNSFLLEYGKILTAKYDFNMLEPFTKDKHDTHIKSTDADYSFPKDFTNNHLNKPIAEQGKTILWNKIIEIVKPIAKVMEKHKDKLIYSDVQNCYYVFGIDMMVRDNFDPVFIEINYSPGVGFKSDIMYDKFSKLYAKWIYETVLRPLFNPRHTNISKHSTYLDIAL